MRYGHNLRGLHGGHGGGGSALLRRGSRQSQPRLFGAASTPLEATRSSGEPSWRLDLAAVWQQRRPQPLTPEALAALEDFGRVAEAEEAALLARLQADREVQEESWKSMADTPARSSKHLLELRAVESALARARDYTAAADAKRAADKCERKEHAQHCARQRGRVSQLDKALVARERFAIQDLQHWLHQELWRLRLEHNL